MTEILDLIAQVGAPIAGALAMGFFIFLIMQQIFAGIVDDINTLKGFTNMLITRVKTMNNDMIRIDSMVRTALGVQIDVDRLARADGKKDQRKD